MVGKEISVPNTSLWALPLSSRLHKNTQTSTHMGSEEGDKGGHIPRQHFDHGIFPPTINQTHNNLSSEIGGDQLPHQRIKILPHALTNNHPSGLQHQHDRDEALSARIETPQPLPLCSQTLELNSVTNQDHCCIHWASDVIVAGSLPSLTPPSTPHSGPEPGTGSEKDMDINSLPLNPSQGGAPLVDRQSAGMEWPQLHPSTIRLGSLH